MSLTRLFALAGTLGLAAASPAQTNPALPAAPPPLGPRIEFAGLNYDFGKVSAGELVRHDFVFTNTGGLMLEIKDVRAGCGCTTMGVWDREVAPGKTGKIPVQFNSTSFNRLVHKVVYVTCNDPANATPTLGLQGTIWRAFDILPMYAVFNLPPDGQTNQTQTVRIISNDDGSVTVSDPVCNNPAFAVELKTLQAGKAFALDVTVIASNVPGSLSAPITLKTSLPQKPEISLTAFATVLPLLSVIPSQIVLPPGPLPKAMQSVVTIQKIGANPIALSEPRVNRDDVAVQLSEREPGHAFNLTLSFPAGFQIQLGETIQATVKSSNPQYPLVTIPVRQAAPLRAAAFPPPVPPRGVPVNSAAPPAPAASPK